MIAENNLKCSELLDLVIDGQATKEQEVELMQHVAECEQCKKEFELSTSITNSLKKRLKKIATPKELSSQIESKITELAS